MRCRTTGSVRTSWWSAWRTIRLAHRELGMMRFVVEKASASERYTVPPMVRQAADAMEAEVRAFVDVARQYVH